MKISARNQLKGKVVKVQKGAVNAVVVLDIGGGNRITSSITNAAVDELGLQEGMDAYALMKASNVMIGIDD